MNLCYKIGIPMGLLFSNNKKKNNSKKNKKKKIFL